MIIQKLISPSKEQLQVILDLQYRAYQVEANLLGVVILPPQKETIDDLLTNKHDVYISYENSTPTGAIFIEAFPTHVWIHKLVVDPNHFRKNIGKNLVSYALDLYPKTTFFVSTGGKNHPALKLYDQLKFKLKEENVIVDGLSIVTLARKT